MKGPETVFREKAIKRFKGIFGRCKFIPLNPPPVQGFPDYLIISPKGTHAYLEFKASKNAAHQPNQDWWVDFLRRGDNFAGFIYPENYEEIRVLLIKLLM